MFRRISILFFMIFMNLVNSQTEEVNLWAQEVPNSIEDNNYQETYEFEDTVKTKTFKVSTPTLQIFKPAQSNGTSVIIFPGGGYEYLSSEKEGVKIANWLNDLGVTAIILNYRLPSDAIMTDRRIGPLQDAQEAVRYVRRHAADLGIDEKRIGIIGFSAGGHLASTLSTQYDREVYKHDNVSARPDFSILIYPVISMKDGITHAGSKSRLIGANASEVDVEQYSNELQVTANTPMTFLVHATDDGSVPVENSINYYLALRKHRISAEMHVYKDGGHGFGLGREGTHTSWPKQCEAWMKANHLLDTKSL